MNKDQLDKLRIKVEGLMEEYPDARDFTDEEIKFLLKLIEMEWVEKELIEVDTAFQKIKDNYNNAKN